jgi:hypothetical protein
LNTAQPDSNVHPIFARHCAAFSGDTLRAAANQPVMHAYMVRFIRGGIVEKQFEAMGVDGCTVAEQHAGMANGAKVDVMPLEKWRTHFAPTQFPSGPVRMSQDDPRFTEKQAARFQRDEARHFATHFPGAGL